MSEVVLRARDLKRFYEVKTSAFRPPKTLKALNGVSFELGHGQTLAVVGESGCGKSTLARLVTQIEKPTDGHLMIDGTDVVGTWDLTGVGGDHWDERSQDQQESVGF